MNMIRVCRESSHYKRFQSLLSDIRAELKTQKKIGQCSVYHIPGHC